MDVESWPAPISLPTIDESNATSPQPPKQRFIERLRTFLIFRLLCINCITYLLYRLLTVLDQVESRVEKLRKDAARIEEEKDNLLATLDAIRDSDWMLELDECK